MDTMLRQAIVCIAMIGMIFFAAEKETYGSDWNVPVSFSTATTQFLFNKPVIDNSIPEPEHLYGKSLPIGIILSLAIPGAGEIYSGRIKWGLIFLGIEAAGWTTYVHYEGVGDDIDAEFRRFADTHWDPAGYRAWVDAYKASHGGNLPNHFTHTLPDTKTQQYYEMIGKYDQFVNWWNDYDANAGPYGQSQRRLYYEERRHQSNVNYDRAKLATMIIFLNHIASVIDTIVGIKKHASSGRGWSWNLENRQIRGSITHSLHITYTW